MAASNIPDRQALYVLQDGERGYLRVLIQQRITNITSLQS